MSQNPEVLDLDTPISLLLENRPYTLSADGRTRRFCFRPTEIISVLQLDDQDQVSNHLTTFEQLANISLPHAVRLPGVANGRLDGWHLSWASVKEELEKGSSLRRNRSIITEQSSVFEWSVWFDIVKVPFLNAEYVRHRILTEHTFNLKVQQIPSAPLIGRISHSKSLELKLKSVLKKDVDLDLSLVQPIYVIGIVPLVGDSPLLGEWVQQHLAQIVLPEMLNVNHFGYDKFTKRLQNMIMQIDNLIYQTDLECKKNSQTSGCGLAISIYIPNALLLISIALGDASIAVFNSQDCLLRSTISAGPNDPAEQSRIRSALESPSELGVSRSLGLYQYKRTENKDYSRAYGAVSAMPEVSVQRLHKNDSFWVCCSRASQFSRTKLQSVGTFLASLSDSTRSVQTLSQSLAEKFDMNDFILAKLNPDSMVKQ